MARLYLSSDPAKSLLYANQATALGDMPAAAVHADVLDTSMVPDSNQVSTNRLRMTSQLLAKLDPCFSYNVSSSEKIKESGFIRYITGMIDTTQC